MEHDYKSLEESLPRLLMELPSFSESELREVRDFVDAAEYGLALETAYQIVLEESKTISRSTLQLFAQINSQMSGQCQVDLDRLSQHVVNDAVNRQQ